MASEQSNLSPPFAEYDDFQSYSIDPVSSVTFSGNSDTNFLEQCDANFSEVPCNMNKEGELILGLYQ